MFFLNNENSVSVLYTLNAPNMINQYMFCANLHILSILTFVVCQPENVPVKLFSRVTKVAYRAKTHIFCTQKVYDWNFVY